MANIGEFGTPRERIDEATTFTYFGETIRVNPEVSDTKLIEFSRRAAAGEIKDTDPEALKTFLASAIHPDDCDLFWSTALANHQWMTDITEVLRQVLGAVAGRPTGQSSDSSRGPTATAPRSKDDSFLRAIDLMEDRPDKLLVLAQRHEASHAG